MELNNSEILFLSELLIKMLKSDIVQKNINEEKDIHDSKASRRQPRKGMLRSEELASTDDDIIDNQFKEFTPEKRKRGRPRKCIPSER